MFHNASALFLGEQDTSSHSVVRLSVFLDEVNDANGNSKDSAGDSGRTGVESRNPSGMDT